MRRFTRHVFRATLAVALGSAFGFCLMQIAKQLPDPPQMEQIQ